MVVQVRWAKCLAPFQTLNQCDQILLLQVIMTLLFSLCSRTIVEIHQLIANYISDILELVTLLMLTVKVTIMMLTTGVLERSFSSSSLSMERCLGHQSSSQYQVVECINLLK